MRNEPLPRPQESFDFESAPPVYDTPKVIYRALCYDDGEFMKEPKDLHVGEDGGWYDEEGNLFEPRETPRGAFDLKRTAEFLGMLRAIKLANPGINENYAFELTRMKLEDRRRAERLAQKMATKVGPKMSGKK